MANTKGKNPMLGYLHWGIGVAIMMLGYVLPSSEPLTPMGVKVLMVFVGMIYLWCTVNPIGGSLLALFMVSVVGYAPFSTILAEGISNPTGWWCFILVFCLCRPLKVACPNISHMAFLKQARNL